MPSRRLASHAKPLVVLVCLSLVSSSVTSFGSARKRVFSGNGRQQIAGATPTPGAPEGSFPDIDEVKVRTPARPRAPLHIPSTLRAKRKPLVPRDGRRVGDPFPVPSPLPSPTPLSSPSPLPSTISSASPLPSPVAALESEDFKSASWLGDGRASSDILSTLLAWNLNDYKTSFNYSPLTDIRRPRESTLDFGLSLREASDVFPNSAFDFFAAPLPQAQSSKIVFVSHRDGNGEIYSMNADGSNPVRLTDDPYHDDNPRWSPDGTKVLFQSDRDNPASGSYDIYVMSADGTGQTRLTFDAADDCNAVWSPDGSKIAFQSLRNGTHYQVYVMNADGTSQVNVTNGIAADSQPSWSPDGTRLAFVSERQHAGRTNIYVMNANGSNQTRLTFTSDPFSDAQPVWSRDGSKLVFVSTRDSIIETWQETDDEGNILNRSAVRTNKELYLMNADGSSQWRLTDTLEADDAPYWSPDGTRIVFRSDRERDCCDPAPQLWTMNADGSNQTVLTSNPYGDYSPSWTVTGNQPPVANAGGPYTAMTSQAVQFNGSGSFDPDGTIASYSWNFGDNTSGSGVSPTHTYASVGTYTVTLTVTDNLWSQATSTTTVTITNQPPVANAGGPYSAMAGQSVQFNGSGSFDPDGSITTYAWNFGDNTSGSGVSPAHAYASAGTYTVTLTVTDNLGSQASTTTSATITSTQPPVANAGGPYSGMTGQAVQFNGSASFDPDGSITSYAWNFGDNSSGSGVSLTHTYNSVGNYTVTLTVTDNLGLQNSATTTANIGTNSMEQYANNFSQWSLLRQPGSSESIYWNDIFRAAYQSGQGSLLLAAREFGRTLFDSSEYAARARSDRDYVYDLYKTYLMREPDQPSWDNWTALVPTYGREQVRGGFEYSVEFINLMATMTANGSITSAASSLSTARVDPKNQPGNGLLTRDGEWSLPLLSLPGRAGLDLGLSLSYSSQVWTRSGPYLYFDEDTGSPSPGFRLGFPTIQGKWFDAQTGTNVYVLITSAGRRVELRQVGTSNVYEAGDSTYLQLIDNGSLLVRSTDGTQMSYGWFNLEFRCTEIKDRNGNYLTINYNWLGDITTITDTLGRTITFNYDTNANLISITQSWKVNGVPQNHVWASFGWGTHTMASGFSNVSVVGAPNGSTLPVLTQVGLHDGSRYNFEYTGAGQVSVIRRFTSDNVQRAYTAYDYQSTADDCPRISATRVWAENWTGINGMPYEVVTQYSELGDGSHQVIAPDGTIYKEFYGGIGSSPAWQKGLLLQSEVWSGGVRQKWTTLNWTQDNEALPFQTNPRVTESNVYDSSGNRRRTTIDYGPYAQYGLPYVVKEYAADGVTEIRHNFTDYNLSQQYLDRRIIGLVSAKLTSDTAWWQTKVTYAYDESGHLQSPPAATVQHDASFSTSVTARGNVTSVSRWDTTDASTLNDPAKALTSRVGYDTNGSALWSADPSNHQTTLSYSDSFSDNINRNTFAYPTGITDADGFSSFIQYNFDFGAKTRIQGPPPAAQPQGLIQSLTYDAAARIERITTTNNGAYARYVYGANYVQSFATVNNLADEAYAIQVFDGVGRITLTAGNHPGSSGGFSGQNRIYDLMGHAVKQSNPTEVTGSWIPSGDDVAGWLYTNQTYDWQGRPLITTNPDGTTKEASYGGCGCAGGEVVTLTDEGTVDAGVFKRRQQKIYSDVLGRTVKTEVLNWQGGSVFSTTLNTYNARDQVTLVRQYAGSEGSSSYQDTAMIYDGYGRLKTKHLPEQDTNAVTTYSYNFDDTLFSETDGRGASKTFAYNNRHFVIGITYEPPSGIAVTPNVSFSYDGAGNRTSMADGLGSATYAYDELSRLTSELRSFNNLGTYPLSYDYNLSNQLISITDPFGAQVGYTHDAAGRLNNVTGSGYANVSIYASDLQYRAWGGLKGLTYGNSLNMAIAYNARLLPTQFEVGGQPPQYGGSTVMKTQFDYFADGSVKYARDVLDERFDRAFSYDHRSMLKEAYSGSESRDYINGTNSGSQTGPFRQSYQHDSFGNLTQRDNRFWSQTDIFTASYTNGRRQGFQYDPDGNLTQDTDLQYGYNAAGENVSITSADGQTRTVVYDGDGQVLKRSQSHPGWSNTLYFVRSSVLGGKIITELDQNGQKQKGYVFAGGELIALQGGNAIAWFFENPVTGSSGSAGLQGAFARDSEPDPMGVNTGFEDPFVNCCELPPPTEEPMPLLLAGSGIPDGRCTLDGIAIECSFAMSLMETGAAAQCPDNYCGPRSVIYEGQRTWAYFNAYGDGYQGYVPITARYIGNGGIAPIGSTGNPRLGRGGQRPDSRGDTDLGRMNGARHSEEVLGRTSQMFFNHPQKRSDIDLGKNHKQPQINTPKERLTDCVKDYLAKFFDRKLLDGIYIHRNKLPAIVPDKDGTGAYASNEHEIWFNVNQYSPNTPRGIARIAHEVEHNYQWKRYGSAFGLLYLGDSLGVFYATGISSAAYPLNRFEISARRREKQVLDDIERNGNPCPR